MKKFLTLLIVPLIVITALTGCSSPAENKTLTIGVLPDVDSIPLILAQQKGYFEDEGVEVTIERFTSAADRDSALQAGAIDGAVSDILAAAFATQGGFEVKITSLTNGSYKMLAGPSMENSSDIAGRSIAISTNTIIEYSTDKMLEELSLTPGDVAKTAIPQMPVRLEMLNSGQIDLATLPEPLASSAIKAGARILNNTDRLGINPGVLLFTNDAVDNKFDELQAFYNAYNKAIDYLQQAELSDYYNILVEQSNFPEGIEDVLELPSYTQASAPSPDDFDGVMQWLTEKGLIDSAYKYEDLVFKGFIK